MHLELKTLKHENKQKRLCCDVMNRRSSQFVTKCTHINTLDY